MSNNDNPDQSPPDPAAVSLRRSTRLTTRGGANDRDAAPSAAPQKPVKPVKKAASTQPRTGTRARKGGGNQAATNEKADDSVPAVQSSTAAQSTQTDKQHQGAAAGAEASSEPLRIRDVIKAMAATNIRVDKFASEIERVNQWIEDSAAAIRTATAAVEKARSDHQHYTAEQDRLLREKQVFENRAFDLAHYIKNDDLEVRISGEDGEAFRGVLKEMEGSGEDEEGEP